jgi:hypothetical protein
MTKEVFVKNIPNNASKSNVVDALSMFGPISKFELRPHKTISNRHAGFGFAEFEEDGDADNCIAFSKFYPPMCMSTELCVFPSTRNNNKKARTIWDDKKKVTFPLSSIEIGNWGGQSSIASTNANRSGSIRRDRRNVTEQFTFLTEWKYPEYYERPIIYFSKAEEAFILEGFNMHFSEDLYSSDSSGSSNSSDPSVSSDSSDSKISPEFLERRVKISFRSLAENSRGMFLDATDQINGVISLYISIRQPPYLYRKAGETIPENIEQFVWVQEEQDFWVRTVDWSGIVNVFGRCLVYRLVFRDNFDQLRDVLNHFKIRGIPRPIPQCVVRCIEKLNYSREYFDSLICRVLPFRTCFKLESLISYGKLTLHEIEEYNLGERLAELIYGEGQEVIAWYALNQIATKHHDPFDKRYQERPISIFQVALRNFRGQFNTWHPSNPNLHLKNNYRCAWVNHATITPTKIYFDGPNYEPSNRILRLYEDKIDHFLRVTFKEENFDRFFIHDKKENLDILNLRISAILNSGFCSAGRHYEFLAFSSSQLKETSCWFVASDGEFNADFIRSNMGDFRLVIDF